MVFQNIWYILWIILHIYCPNSQKLYFWNWLVKMIQWNPIGVILLYYRQHLIRNTSQSSLMLLELRCLQSFPCSASLLWLQFSTLTYQDFHKIGLLPCRNPCMVSLDITYLGHPLKRYDCWLEFYSLSMFLSTKPFWCFLVIWWLVQNSWFLKWIMTLMCLF